MLKLMVILDKETLICSSESTLWLVDIDKFTILHECSFIKDQTNINSICLLGSKGIAAISSKLNGLQIMRITRNKGFKIIK